MYFYIVIGIGSYTTSTTNMYKKDRFHEPGTGSFNNVFPFTAVGPLLGMAMEIKVDRASAISTDGAPPLLAWPPLANVLLDAPTVIGPHQLSNRVWSVWP